MVNSLLFLWVLSVFLSVIPFSNPLNIIFNIVMISSFLFLFFSLEGGSAIGFLWVLVYIGGMLIVFLYLIFLTYSSNNLSETSEILAEIPMLIILIIMLSSFFLNIIFLEAFHSLSYTLSFEGQEFYSLIISTSCSPIFTFLLGIISVSLVLFLGVLSNNIFQTNISIFFHFIISNVYEISNFKVLEVEIKVALGDMWLLITIVRLATSFLCLLVFEGESSFPFCCS